jgi:hypothetical protein
MAFSLPGMNRGHMQYFVTKFSWIRNLKYFKVYAVGSGLIGFKAPIRPCVSGGQGLSRRDTYIRLGWFLF